MNEEDAKELFESGMYFRRDGTPYENHLEWAQDFEKGMELRRVAETILWWGGYVSTVWLGLNHNCFDGPPLIFESMLFSPSGRGDMDMDRYSTEAEAIAGHNRMVKKWQFNLIGITSAWLHILLDKTKSLLR